MDSLYYVDESLMRESVCTEDDYEVLDCRKETRGDKEVLVRQVAKCSLTRATAVSLVREIEILTLLKGQRNILNLQTAYEDATSVHMVFDYCPPGSVPLSNLFSDGQGVEELRALCVLRQVAGVLERLHREGYAHCGITPESIAIDPSTNNTTLVRFDTAVRFGPNGKISGWVGPATCGAPEASTHGTYCPMATDIWALGYVAYAAAVGNCPLGDDDNLLGRLKGGIISFPATLSRDLRRMLRYMLSVRPEDRPTARYVASEAARILSLRQPINRFGFVRASRLQRAARSDEQMVPN